MRPGQHLPKDERPQIARRALELFEAQPSREQGIAAVEEAFKVSSPTARNLVSWALHEREGWPR